jgi:nucleotide-binding universal stress UspA family protein
MKTLLVEMLGTERDAALLSTAAVLARSFGAHLDCLRVSPDPMTMISYLDYADMAAYSVAHALAGFQQSNRERRDAARAAFDSFCASEALPIIDRPGTTVGPSATWHELTGNPCDELVKASRVHDLTLLAGGARLRNDLSPGEFSHVVLSAGKPLLIVPASGMTELPRRVGIAWKSTPEAARAVTAAMPFLNRAERILVASAREHDRHVSAPEALVRQLGWHGLSAESHVIADDGRSAAERIIDAAANARIDLLVMGAYSHGRLRELVLGGFTAHILKGSDLPVLITH